MGEWVVGPPKADAPCDSYFGNVCGGFGARTVCLGCGWDRIDHPNEFTRFKSLFVDGILPGARVETLVRGEWVPATIERRGLLDTWVVRLDEAMTIDGVPHIDVVYRQASDVRVPISSVVPALPEIHWRADA